MHQGQCLCGAVKITINSTHEGQVKCHCSDCRHTSGSAFSTNVLVKNADLKFEGPVKEYTSKALSGNTVARVFCEVCGSPLAHKSVAFGDAVAVQTGNVPDFAKISFDAELFVKDRWAVIPAVEGAGQAQIM